MGKCSGYRPVSESHLRQKVDIVLLCFQPSICWLFSMVGVTQWPCTNVCAGVRGPVRSVRRSVDGDSDVPQYRCRLVHVGRVAISQPGKLASWRLAHRHWARRPATELNRSTSTTTYSCKSANSTPSRLYQCRNSVDYRHSTTWQ